MSKKVLFLAPVGLDIYRDVIHALEDIGCQVDFVSSSAIPNNPFKPFDGVKRTEEEVGHFLDNVTEFWKRALDETEFNKPYDYFFSIDGLMVCDFLFEALKNRNPRIICKLFLYDKIDYACRVNRFFKYYDSIFSFDLGDCEQYGLRFLPIYWVDTDKSYEKKYDIFGLASYSFHKKDRAALFRQIRSVSKELNLNSYIKLYVRMGTVPFFFYIKNIVKMLSRRSTYIPFEDIFSGLVTNKSLSPEEFRDVIYSSDIIFDTHVAYQDGLTARFMWALGAGKKIITTNSAINKYPFYNKDQFYVLESPVEDMTVELRDFINKPFNMSEEEKEAIKVYRIDNWLKTILS